MEKDGEQFGFIMRCFKSEYDKHRGKDSEQAKLYTKWTMKLWDLEYKTDEDLMLWIGRREDGRPETELDKCQRRFDTYFHTGEGCLSQTQLEQFLASRSSRTLYKFPPSLESLFIMESLSKMSDKDLLLMAGHASKFPANWYSDVVSKLVTFFRCLRWGMESNILGTNKDYNGDEFTEMLETLSINIADKISKTSGHAGPHRFSYAVAHGFLSSWISQQQSESQVFFHVLKERCYSPFRVGVGDHVHMETFEFKYKTLIGIHKVILKLRLEQSADYNSTVNYIKEDTKKQHVTHVALEMFAKLLYGVAPLLWEEDDRSLKLEVIKCARIFRVSDPVHFLFGSDVSPVSPERIMNLIDFATVFEDSPLSAHLYMNPTKYFAPVILKEFPVPYVRDILMRDDLNLLEKDVYKLVRSYISQDQRDVFTSKRLIVELKRAIRFAFLTQEELLEAVSDGFLEPDEFGNFFLAAALTEKEQYKFKPEEVQRRFFKPLVRRLKCKNEPETAEPEWVRTQLKLEGDEVHQNESRELSPSPQSTQDDGAPPYKKPALDSSSGTPKIVLERGHETESSPVLHQKRKLESAMSSVLRMKQDSKLDQNHILTLGSIEKDLRELQGSLIGTARKPNISSSPCDSHSSASSSSTSKRTDENPGNAMSPKKPAGTPGSKRKTRNVRRV